MLPKVPAFFEFKLESSFVIPDPLISVKQKKTLWLLFISEVQLSQV